VNKLSDYSNMLDDERALLTVSVEPLGTLAQVIRWGLSLSPERTIVTVVVQDEYTHDVVMDWDRGRFLVFDTT